MVDHDGVFWLKGTPGSGKSVLTRWTYRRMIDTMSSASSEISTIVTGFFFNARGKKEANSATGFYRAMIYQIVSQVPTLFECIPADIKSAMHHVPSSLSSLQRLYSCLISSEIPLSITAFIDALDECADDSTDLLLTMLDYADQAHDSNSNLKICFSSRPDSRFDLGAPMSLDIQNTNGAAILRYIHNEVNKVGRRLPVSNRERRLLDLQALASLIAKRANGMFLWARLVLPRIRDAILRHLTPSEIELMLSNIPSELKGPKGLFGEILDKIVESASETSLRETIQMFQWIVFAERPLLLNELIIALAVRKGGSCLKDGSTWGCCGNDHYAMERIPYQCGNLVQILDESKTIQPIHQTVKEYFTSGRGFEHLGMPYHGILSAFVHSQIALDCAKFLSLKEVQGIRAITEVDDAIEHSHLLNYGLDFCFIHAERAESGGIDQNGLLDAFKVPEAQLFENYVFLRDQHLRDHWRVCPRDEYHRPVYGPGTTFVHVAAEHNLLSCMARLITLGYDLNAHGGAFGSAIRVAAEKNYCQMLRTLLENGAIPHPLSLEFAVTDHQLEILRLIASNGLPGEESALAMVAAAIQGNSKVVRVFLESLATGDTNSMESGGQINHALWLLKPISESLPFCLNSKLDHSQCLGSNCQTYLRIQPRVDPRHVDETCQCSLIMFKSEQISSIILRGNVPVIRRCKTGWSVSDAIPYHDQYIAISHLWADGLGNSEANALPLCQLDRIGKVVRNIGEDNTGFWIDTIGVPGDNQYQQARQVAIASIAQTFHLAESVLVLIRELQENQYGGFEKLAAISISRWSRQLWLRSEQRLAKSLVFHFRDCAMSREQLVKDIQYQFEIPLHETTALPNANQFSHISSGLSVSHGQFSGMTRLDQSGHISLESYASHDKLVAMTRLLQNTDLPRFRADESLVLAMILDFPVRDLFSNGNPNLGRVLEHCESVPQDFLFLDGPKLESPGFRWAPKTFFGVKETFEQSSPANPPAPLSPRGLVVMYQGIWFQWPETPISGSLRISCGEQDSRSYFTLVESQNGVENGDRTFEWPSVQSPALIFRGRPGPIDVGILVSLQNDNIPTEELAETPGVLYVRYVLRVMVYKETHPLSPPLARGTWTAPLQKWCVG